MQSVLRLVRVNSNSLLIFIFPILSSLGCNSIYNYQELHHFEECYSEKKQMVLFELISQLDEKVTTRYPGKTIKESYKKYGSAWYSDIKTDPLLTQKEIKTVETKMRSAGLLDDLFRNPKSSYDSRNFESSFMNCLRASSSQNLSKYISRVEEIGAFGPSLTMDAFVQYDNYRLSDLVYIVMKLELLIYYIEYTDFIHKKDNTL